MKTIRITTNELDSAMPGIFPSLAVTPEAESNARLIAAAPDMLKALQLVASIWSSDQTTNVAPDSPLAIVRAAIARATA